VTGTRKFDHISPVLRQLHWLPVRQRITFKLAMFTFKCLHGLAPSYLADCVHPGLVLSSAGGSCGRQTAGHSSCRAQGPRSVGGILPWLARPLGTSSLFRDTFAKKTQNSFIWLRALLRSSVIGRYTNWHIHSFIHSFTI